MALEPPTVAALNTAWDTYIAALTGGDVTSQVRSREQLYQAASAHAAGSRPLGSITRYYAVVNDDPDSDPAYVQELAQELDAMRRATAILNGAWPGAVPIVGG